jgi:monofunctional biosynthetic peptidoglycan transglycosylase
MDRISGAQLTQLDDAAKIPAVKSGTSRAAPTARGSRRSRWRTAFRVLRTLVIVVALLATVPFLGAVAYRGIDPPITSPILADRLSGEAIDQRWMPIGSISPHLIKAVVSSEDAAFCTHHGVDWDEMQEALSRAEKTGRGVRGASTITMQVAKNLFLWNSRSYVRKAIELPLAYWIDFVMPKRRVLEIYLNIAEWGPGIYGAEAAARRHFNKPAAALDRREAALLATSLPNPILRKPEKPSRRHRILAATIEGRMLAADAWTGCIFGAKTTRTTMR